MKGQVYDFIYMTFWKMQNFSIRKQTGNCQALGFEINYKTAKVTFLVSWKCSISRLLERSQDCTHVSDSSLEWTNYILHKLYLKEAKFKNLI